MMSGCERWEEENPSLRTDSTQELAPIVCQCLQCTDRQPPTRNRGETLSRGLLPGPFSFATGAAGATEKGALPLRPLCFQPRGVEEEEGDVKACCCDRGTTGETPPRSAEEADNNPPWTVQTKISEESSEDATPAEQERRSKPLASCSGQSQARKWEKFQKTREGQHNVSGRPLQPGP